MVLADIAAALIGVRLGAIAITEPEAIRLAEKILERVHTDACRSDFYHAGGGDPACHACHFRILDEFDPKRCKKCNG